MKISQLPQELKETIYKLSEQRMYSEVNRVEVIQH
jgi:hypothetical protein